MSSALHGVWHKVRTQKTLVSLSSQCKLQAEMPTHLAPAS